MINKILDPNLQKEYIKKYLESLKQEKESREENIKFEI